VVAGDEDLVGRSVFKEVLAHEARRDDVAPGQLLDLRLGPATALLGLGCGDEAQEAQAARLTLLSKEVAHEGFRGEGAESPNKSNRMRRTSRRKKGLGNEQFV
jgi:hypothetical protein